MASNSWWSPFGGINGDPSEESHFSDNNKMFSSTQEISLEKTQEATQLFTLIKNRKWREAGMRVKSVPKEAVIWITECDESGTVMWRQLAIHKACEVHPPEKLMEILISAHPRGVQLKNSNGDLPLHIACSECAGGNVINMLIYHYPDGARVKNDEGKLPLHLACRQWNDVQLIKNLLVAYNQGAHCADSDGLLPLHCACGQDVAPEIIERLLYAFPDAVAMKDRWGRTPLAIAMSGKSTNKESIISSLKRDISYWRVGLIDEVNTLKTELEKTAEAEKEYSEKACTLEEELMHITSRSNEAAKSFREMKGNLEGTNKDLMRKLRSVNMQLEEREQKIGQLIVENMNYKSRLTDLEARLGALSSILPSIEEQRHQILVITGKWEDSLREASNHIDVEDVHPRTPSDQRQDNEHIESITSSNFFKDTPLLSDCSSRT